MSDKTYKDFTAGSFDPLRILLTANPTTGELRKVTLPQLLGFDYILLAMSQAGTAAPTVNSSVKTIATAVSTTRNGVGDYTLTCTGAFTSGKTIILCNPTDPDNNAITLRFERVNANSISIVNDSGTDDISNISIAILILP
jgi:hypothetical protein